jgi:lysophospholipase L1-like esterase
MTTTNRKYLVFSVVALAALVTIDQFPASAFGPERMQLIERLQQTLNRLELNEEESAEQTAGYYEGLLNERSQLSSMGAFTSARLGLDRRRRPRHPTIRALRLEDRYLRRPDFLVYVAKPNLDVPDYDDETLRLVTNSRGWSDREYPIEKPAGVRRIAVVGDSISRGQGAPFGESYEALLERRLNEAAGASRVEIINFSVSGYRMTQLLETALTEAAAFNPDAYVIAISELTVFRRWGDHLKELVDSGIDLKYEFLRDLVRRANLQPGDAVATAEAKLAPFRLETVRWVVETIADHASSRRGSALVLLLPSVKNRAAIDTVFAGLPETLEHTGVPVLNLLSTYDELPDLNVARVSSDNYHPNRLGHRLLFERIQDAIEADASIRAAILGPDQQRAGQ